MTGSRPTSGVQPLANPTMTWSVSADSACSASSHSSETVEQQQQQPSYHGLDFQLVVEKKSGGPTVVVHLAAPSMQDKTAWISDISQVRKRCLSQP